MPVYYNGELVSGLRGPAGPDGNPIGTILSFMGLKAPKDYLVCDGAEYNISAYPVLAAFFEEQFGASNHFGGDGTSTFAVPDLRNLFLRGFHGDAEEQLSGEVGEKQEATRSPEIGISDENAIIFNRTNTPRYIENFDTSDGIIPSSKGAYITPINAQGNYPMNYAYTSRPVNMAVLYCIKAV